MRVLLLALALSALQGCTVWSYNLGDSLRKVNMPAPTQQLLVADVLERLGPPLRMSATASGYVMAWERWHIEERKLGLSLGFAGADMLSLDWGSAQTKGEFMVLGFTHKHQLIDSVYHEWQGKVGGGQGIQPFVGVVSVVDVDDLVRRLPQHRWGAASLDELPQTLNNQNRINTGQNGIEQRGTSNGVGQKSLEMH